MRIKTKLFGETIRVLEETITDFKNGKIIRWTAADNRIESFIRNVSMNNFLQNALKHFKMRKAYDIANALSAINLTIHFNIKPVRQGIRQKSLYKLCLAFYYAYSERIENIDDIEKNLRAIAENSAFSIFDHLIYKKEFEKMSHRTLYDYAYAIKKIARLYLTLLAAT